MCQSQPKAQISTVKPSTVDKVQLPCVCVVNLCSLSTSPIIVETEL